MAERTQTLASHRRFIPAFHFFALPILLINVFVVLLEDLLLVELFLEFLHVVIEIVFEIIIEVVVEIGFVEVFVLGLVPRVGLGFGPNVCG